MRAALVLALAALAIACAVVPVQPSAPAAGERAYQQCFSCHSLEPGKNDLDGPSLHRIVGKPVAAEAGFNYSPAMRRFAETNPLWTRELLDRFAADPQALVPGTSMSFTGMTDAAERKALIEYLARADRP